MTQAQKATDKKAKKVEAGLASAWATFGPDLVAAGLQGFRAFTPLLEAAESSPEHAEVVREFEKLDKRTALFVLRRVAAGLRA